MMRFELSFSKFKLDACTAAAVARSFPAAVGQESTAFSLCVLRSSAEAFCFHQWVVQRAVRWVEHPRHNSSTTLQCCSYLLQLHVKAEGLFQFEIICP